MGGHVFGGEILTRLKSKESAQRQEQVGVLVKRTASEWPACSYIYDTRRVQASSPYTVICGLLQMR